jgi:invasion protein IalB
MPSVKTNTSQSMNHRGVFRALAIGRPVAAVALIAAAAIAVAPLASTQEPPVPTTQPETRPNGPPAPTEQPQPPQGEQPQLTFTPWTKVCQKGQEPNAVQICFIGISSMPVVAVLLIVREGQPKKVLRVTLPLGMAIQPGTRAIVDDGQPMTAPYVLCFTYGCMADYEASEELIDKMKEGKNLHVHGINGSGQPVSLQLPLADFAKAYDGPPADPKTMAPPPKQ